MDLKFLKGMKLDDLLNLDYGNLKEQEVAYVEKRLINTANRRINRLKKEGLISKSSLTAKEKKGLKPYKVPKGGVRVTRGGKTVKINVRDKRLSSIKKAREVLQKKNATVKGLSESDLRYKKVISDTLGHEVKLDKRRLKRLHKLMAKAQELYGLGDSNKKFTGSPIILQVIVDIVKSRKYIKNDDAEEIIMTAVEDGYKQAQSLMKDFLDIEQEENEGTDLDFLTDDDYRGIF